MLKNIFSKKTLKLLLFEFFGAFGLLALILGVVDILFPNHFNSGMKGLFAMAVISILYALYKGWPRKSMARTFTEPDMKITIKEGDLFAEDTHLVIGMNDVFDIQLGKIISPNSIQGQFLAKYFNGDLSQLTNAIEKCLADRKYEIDDDKKEGNNKRYPIGTVACIDNGKRKFFCSAYSKMSSDLVADSDSEKMSLSLNELWKVVRDEAQQEKVSMPIVGSALSRVGLSYDFMLKLILFTFVTSSRKKIVTKDLTIVVHPQDLEKINLAEIKEFLFSL